MNTVQHGRDKVVSRGIPKKIFTCTVTGATPITDTFHRVHLHGPDLLQAIGSHPTMWARFWFRKNARAHQRAFTLINAQPSEGTLDIDVHVHGGTAGEWARNATPGSSIDATLQGTGFAAPRASTTHMHLIGDAASIPAIRSILQAFPDLPATLWLEQQNDSEMDIPLHARFHDDVVRIARGDGTPLIAAVQEGLSRRSSAGSLKSEWFWLACEASANRALLVQLRSKFGVPRSNVAAMAYWKAE